MGSSRGGKTRFDMLYDLVSEFSGKMDKVTELVAVMNSRISSLEEECKSLRVKVRSCQDNCYPSVRKLERDIQVAKISVWTAWGVVSFVSAVLCFLYKEGIVTIHF